MENLNHLQSLREAYVRTLARHQALVRGARRYAYFAKARHGGYWAGWQDRRDALLRLERAAGVSTSTFAETGME